MLHRLYALLQLLLIHSVIVVDGVDRGVAHQSCMARMLLEVLELDVLHTCLHLTKANLIFTFLSCLEHITFDDLVTLNPLEPLFVELFLVQRQTAEVQGNPFEVIRSFVEPVFVV